jgi:hypothetical protein
VLEDPDRQLEHNPEAKIKSNTAIPRGKYSVIVNQSQRFKRLLPLLVGVPGFEGVRIHPGNTSADTEGCLLPGFTRAVDRVLESKRAFEPLMVKILNVYNNGEHIEIEVV